jgi:hypothetical protein
VKGNKNDEIKTETEIAIKTRDTLMSYHVPRQNYFQAHRYSVWTSPLLFSPLLFSPILSSPLLSSPLLVSPFLSCPLI